MKETFTPLLGGVKVLWIAHSCADALSTPCRPDCMHYVQEWLHRFDFSPLLKSNFSRDLLTL